jgi:hypothetical protein
MFRQRSRKHISQTVPTGSRGFRMSATREKELMTSIKTLVGFVSLLQIPRNLIKFWQAHLKPSIITYEQSGTELKEISQPEVFEVSRLSLSASSQLISSGVSVSKDTSQLLTRQSHRSFPYRECSVLFLHCSHTYCVALWHLCRSGVYSPGSARANLLYRLSLGTLHNGESLDLSDLHCSSTSTSIS